MAAKFKIGDKVKFEDGRTGEVTEFRDTGTQYLKDHPIYSVKVDGERGVLGGVDEDLLAAVAKPKAEHEAPKAHEPHKAPEPPHRAHETHHKR